MYLIDTGGHSKIVVEDDATAHWGNEVTASTPSSDSADSAAPGPMMSSLADPAAPLTNSGYRSALARMLPAIFHAYPLAIGRGTIANSQLVRDLLAAAPSEEVAAKAGDGRLIVQTDDYVGRTVLLFGDLDAKVSWVVDKLLQTGDNMLDVGANWGLVGMRAAGRVEPTGQVHAVEPQARLVAYGEASRDLNGYANVTFHNLALSETAGVMTLHVPAGNYGQGTLTPQTREFHGYVTARFRGTDVRLSGVAGRPALAPLEDRHGGSRGSRSAGSDALSARARRARCDHLRRASQPGGGSRIGTPTSVAWLRRLRAAARHFTPATRAAQRPASAHGSASP